MERARGYHKVKVPVGVRFSAPHGRLDALGGNAKSVLHLSPRATALAESDRLPEH